jgi:hypothetical protein
MSISARSEDRSIARKGDAPLDRLKYSIVSYAASLLINAAFVLLMILEMAAREETAVVVETPIEVVVEAPPPPEPLRREIKSESAPPPQPPPARQSADAKESMKDMPSLREIAKEDRERKAPQGKETIDGDGKDDARAGAPQEPSDKRESENADPDPNKEISHLVAPAPAKPVPRPKAKIAPPGQLKEPAAKRKKPDEKATDNETTMKEKDVTCGANAKVPMRSSPRMLQGQVLGRLTKDQVDRMILMTQAQTDMFISPHYRGNVRVFVRFDGMREGAWAVALLPPGLSVQAGDRVEIAGAHLDPSTPCHYIPAVVSRVL